VKSKLTDAKTSLNRDRHARKTQCILINQGFFKETNGLSESYAAW